MLKLPRRGSYTGRLAFDPDSGFHIDAAGRKLVSLDEGKTWRYAARGDISHQARYSRRILVVDSTANAASPEPHHFNVQPDDAHHHPDPAKAGTALLKQDADGVAEYVTSHTEAYA
jgi:hypothetical protein